MSEALAEITVFAGKEIEASKIPGVTVSELDIMLGGAARFAERFGGVDVASELQTLTQPADSQAAGKNFAERKVYQIQEDNKHYYR